VEEDEREGFPSSNNQESTISRNKLTVAEQVPPGYVETRMPVDIQLFNKAGGKIARLLINIEPKLRVVIAIFLEKIMPPFQILKDGTSSCY